MKNVYEIEAKILLAQRGKSLWANDFNYGVRFELAENHIEVYTSAFVMGGGGCLQDNKEPSYTMSFEEFYNKHFKDAELFMHPHFVWMLEGDSIKGHLY